LEWIHTEGIQKKLLAGIIFFNLLDIIFTLLVVNLGFAVEANPFMLEILEINEIFFAGIKLSLVSLCVFLLWRLREYRVARISTFFCFLTYGCLMTYHIFGIAISVRLFFTGNI
jgi:hypothetical protein